MKIVDLTRWETPGADAVTTSTREVHLVSGRTAYHGVVHDFELPSMFGTYIDFPGHIRETDDGVRSEEFPLIYRRPARVLRLACEAGPVTADDLAAAAGGPVAAEILIVNALGRRNPAELPPRSVYLDAGAVEWIIGTGCRLLVSDVYESVRLEGVFLRLFAAGISTVCEPVKLYELTAPTVELTVLYPPIAGATQIPCRMLAEFK